MGMLQVQLLLKVLVLKAVFSGVFFDLAQTVKVK